MSRFANQRVWLRKELDNLRANPVRYFRIIIEGAFIRFQVFLDWPGGNGVPAIAVSNKHFGIAAWPRG